MPEPPAPSEVPAPVPPLPPLFDAPAPSESPQPKTTRVKRAAVEIDEPRMRTGIIGRLSMILKLAFPAMSKREGAQKPGEVTPPCALPPLPPLGFFFGAGDDEEAGALVDDADDFGPTDGSS